MRFKEISSVLPIVRPASGKGRSSQGPAYGLPPKAEEFVSLCTGDFLNPAAQFFAKWALSNPEQSIG
jgi:hypothetical protein